MTDIKTQLRKTECVELWLSRYLNNKRRPNPQDASQQLIDFLHQQGYSIISNEPTP